MAEYDGSIRIGTGIDTKEFKAGSKEIETEARRMAKTVSSSLGDSAKIALQKQTDAFVKMNQQYANQEQKVKDLGEKLHELQRQKVETAEFKELSKDLDKAKASLDRLYEKRDSYVELGKKTPPKLELDISDAERKVKILEADIKELQITNKAYVPVDTSKVQQEIAAAEQKQMQMYTALQTAADALTQKTSAQAVEEERLAQIKENAVVGNQRIVETVERIKQLEQEIADLKAAGITEGYEDYDSRIQELEQLKQEVKDYANGTNEMQDSYKRLGQALTDLNGKLSSISQIAQTIKQSFSSSDVNVSGYERWNSALEELKGTARRVSESMKQSFSDIRENGIWAIVDMTNRMSSSLVSKLGDALDRTSEKIGEILMKPVALAIKAGAAIKYAFSSAFEVVKEKAAGLAGSAINAILHPFQTLKSVASTAVSGTANVLKSVLSPALEEIKARAAGVAATIINGIAHPFQTMKAIASGAISTTSELLSGMVSTAKKVGSAIKNMVSMLKKAVSSMSLFGKSTKSSNNMLNSGFKAILKYGLGIRSTYILVNKLRTAIKEGFSNMAKEVDGFGSKVNSLKASTLTLKNAFAAAFRPLVEIALPYIQMVVDAMANLLDTVGQFMAAITGQKTYTKAIKQTTAAIEDENKAQNKQLSGLDKLNNLSSGSGGGADSGASSQMFEENVPISSPFLDMYQNLKDLIENEDWEGIGSYIAGALNKGLQRIYDVINWDNVGPQITYFVNAFTGAFNGLVDGFDWNLLGQTIGAGINTAVNTLNLLITGIDWVSLGTGLANGLNGLANEVDFTNLGMLIGNKFMILPRMLLGFVSNLEWGDIGTEIGNALNGIAGSIKLSEIGEMLGKGLTGIFQSAISFSATFDWKDLGENIYSGINSFFKNVEWDKVGEGINDFVLGLLDALITAIEGTEWEALGEGLVEAGSKLKLDEILIDVGTVLLDLGKAALQIVSGGLKSSIKKYVEEHLGRELTEEEFKGVWDKLFGENASIWEALKKSISFKRIFEAMKKAAGHIWGGLAEGISDAFSNIGSWIKENIFDPFIKGFKDLFGIHSPSTVMEEQGGFIMEGLLNGISSMIDSVISLFSEVKEKILEKWDEIKKKTSEVWEGIKTKISDIWSGIKSSVSGASTSVKTTISGVWENIKGKTSNIWENMKSSITNVLNGIKTGISNALNSIKSIWDKVWTGLKTTVTNIFNGIWNTIKVVINSILGGIESMANGVINGINFVIGALNKLHIDIPAPIAKLTGFESFGFDIPELSQVSIPRLATGTVVPPNNEFLAVLGDNKREPEVVSPLSTIEQAVENAMRRNGGMGGGEITIKIPVEIDGRVLFELMKKFDLQQYRRTGRPSFQM